MAIFLVSGGSIWPSTINRIISEIIEMPTAKELKEQGLSVAEIAKQLGKSRSTVYGQLWSAGPPPRRYPDNLARDELCQLVYEVMQTERRPRLTAARLVLERASHGKIIRASASTRPVNARRLANWCKPE